MKFRINREHFSNGLQQVLNIVGPKASLPILSNVLIRASEGQVALTTTNLDMGICCSVRADIAEPGSITLPVRRLATIVRSLPNTEVVLETNSSNQAKITSGGSQFKVMGMAEEDFPLLSSQPHQKSFLLGQEELTQMIRHVSYAQSSDESRYVLNGTYFSFEATKLSLVATDGRRLALISKEITVPAENTGTFILPAKTVAEVQRLMGRAEDVKVTFNERQAAFDIRIDEKNSESSGLAGSIFLVSKVVDGVFPNYKQVIPEVTEHRIKIEREMLLDCVQRASLVVSDQNHAVRMRLSPNLLEISGSSPEVGESHESMAISYEGPQVQVAFNPQYLIDPLKALNKDEIFFEFKDELSPGLFKTLDSFLCVVMPLRLGSN